MGFLDDLVDNIAGVVLLPITVPVKVIEKLGDIMFGDD